jgi:hypothetical protein
MSYKVSTRFWYVGPVDLHVFVHCFDEAPHPQRYVTLGIGRQEWFLWPPHGRQCWEANVLPRAAS